MSLQEKMCNISIRKYFVHIIVAFFIAGLEIVGELLDVIQQIHDGVSGVTLGIKQVTGFGFKAFFLWIFIAALIVLLDKYGKKAYCFKGSKCPIFAKKLYTWLVIVASWIPCFIAYFPGIYSYDGEPQLIQYTTGQFDNHHPVFHTLILGGCYDFGQWLKSYGIMIDGIAFYSIIQMAVLAFALSCVVTYITKCGAGRVIQWSALLLFTLFPATPVMAISTTKDTLFTAVFVMVVIKGLEIIDKETLDFKSSIEICIYAILCMLFRRNASYVAWIMLLMLVIKYLVKFIKNRQLVWDKLARCVVICFASIAIFNACEKSIMLATDAVQGESAEALSVPLMQIARAYNSNKEVVTDKYGEELFDYITLLGLANYRPLISDGVKQGFNNELFAENKAGFVSIYFDMLKDYPGSYVTSFLYMTKGDWQLMDNTHCEVYKDWWRNRTGYLITDDTEVFALGFVTKSNFWPGLRAIYESIVTDCSYRSFIPLKVVFAPAFYVFMTLLGGLALIRQKRSDRFEIWLIAGLYLLTIIAGPCVLVRYIFPLMMLAPLMWTFIFGNGD